MLEWVLKYWIEIAFGLICAFIGWIWKRSQKILTDAQLQRQNEFYEDLDKRILKSYEKVTTVDEQLQSQIDRMTNSMSTLRKGLLSLQGKNFKEKCHEVLQDNHILTLQEYENLLVDHDTYNELGGNHEGDALWNLVDEKAKQTFGKE